MLILKKVPSAQQLIKRPNTRGSGNSHFLYSRTAVRAESFPSDICFPGNVDSRLSPAYYNCPDLNTFNPRAPELGD